MKTWIIISLCLLGCVALESCDACCHCEKQEATLGHEASDDLQALEIAMKWDKAVGIIGHTTEQEPDNQCGSTKGHTTMSLFAHEFWRVSNWPSDQDDAPEDNPEPEVKTENIHMSPDGTFELTLGLDQYSVEMIGTDGTDEYSFEALSVFDTGDANLTLLLETTNPNNSIETTLTKECVGGKTVQSPPKSAGLTELPMAEAAKVTIGNSANGTAGAAVYAPKLIFTVNKRRKCPNNNTLVHAYSKTSRNRVDVHRYGRTVTIPGSKTKLPEYTRKREEWRFWNFAADEVLNDICIDLDINRKPYVPIVIHIQVFEVTYNKYAIFMLKIKKSAVGPYTWCLSSYPKNTPAYQKKYTLGKVMAWPHSHIATFMVQDTHWTRDKGATWGTPVVTGCKFPTI